MVNARMVEPDDDVCMNERGGAGNLNFYRLILRREREVDTRANASQHWRAFKSSRGREKEDENMQYKMKLFIFKM